GPSFRTVAVALCAVEGGDAASSHSVGNPVVDDIAAQLTSYRRWLLRHRRDEPMPLVYNDFMNTLMGQPSTQALIPLVKEAGALGLTSSASTPGGSPHPRSATGGRPSGSGTKRRTDSMTEAWHGSARRSWTREC